jgi:hypothetical protein
MSNPTAPHRPGPEKREREQLLDFDVVIIALK